MLDFLVKLKAGQIESAQTLYLPPGLSKSEAEELLSLRGNPAREQVLETVVGSTTGAAIFYGDPNYLILPPFPLSRKVLLPGYATESLRTILEQELKIGVVLVRLGAYAIGWCQGERITDSKVGTGLVHSRHRQGGSSAGRFKRHREKQIEQFLIRVCEHARERLESQAKSLDYVIYGGAWNTIELLQKECPFLSQFNNRLLPPLLDTPKPNSESLRNAVKRVWSSQVIEFENEN